MGDAKEESRPSNVHATAAGGFTKAAHYDKVRSGYTRESVEFLLKKVDLVVHDGEVEKAESSSDPVTVLELGSGTALPSSSVDVVLAAQSFHWFATPDALAEINRVLVPGGRLGIVFNLPDESEEWVQVLISFYTLLYHQQAVPNAWESGWKRQLLTSEWFCDHVEDRSCRLFQESSIDAAYDTFASISVIANGSDPVKAAFRELFDVAIKTHFTDKGREFCHIPYVTTMWWCTTQKKDL